MLRWFSLWLRLWITRVFKKDSNMLLIYSFLIFLWFQDLIVYQSLKMVVGIFDKGVHMFSTDLLPLTQKSNLEQSSAEPVVTGSLWSMALRKLPADLFTIGLSLGTCEVEGSSESADRRLVLVPGVLVIGIGLLLLCAT